MLDRERDDHSHNETPIERERATKKPRHTPSKAVPSDDGSERQREIQRETQRETKTETQSERDRESQRRARN